MGKGKNLASRAFAALIAGREREAQRFVAHFERSYSRLNSELTKK